MRFISAQKSHSGVQIQTSYNTEAAVPREPTIHSVFETKTATWQYVVADPLTMTAAIIDPVLDYDSATQVVITQTADSLLSLVKKKGYTIAWILETHAHADHLTASSYLQKRLGQEQGRRPPVGIGRRIEKVQELFGKKYCIPMKEYGNVFDKLFNDDEEFEIGNLKATAIHLPGHTPDHMGYMIGGKTSTMPIDLCVLTIFWTTYSAVIPSFMQTLAPHAATSPAAVLPASGARHVDFLRCLTIPKSGQATTIRPTDAMSPYLT